MTSIIATVLFIALLIFGGGGATVAAAQTSQPDQPLYAVKLFSEDTRLRMSADPQTQVRLALEFADRRAAEIAAMINKGNIPAEAVQSRYQNQVEQAIRAALNLPDDQAVQALEQVQTRLQTQEQALVQVQTKGAPKAEAAMLRLRQMLQERLKWVQSGLADPAQLRHQFRRGPAAPGNQPTNAPTQSGNGNPWTTGTPTPGSGYGPGKGSGDCEACTPRQKGQGGNPWTTGTPTPNSGYGPGPGPEVTCTRTPNSGPQSTQSQNNQPTQAGPQPTQASQPSSPGKGPQPGGNGRKH